MSTCVLELNDIGIRVFSRNNLLYESPGYALVDGKQILTGKPAQSQARLSPRKVNTRFWSQLSLDPLNMQSSRVQHTADLAWLHLAEIQSAIQGSCKELILALPGTFSKQQLGLLLGIAQECSIKVSGLVDSALAAVASLDTQENSVTVDIHLHRIVSTHVVADSALRKGEVEVLANMGLVTLQEIWAETLSDLFVRHTRFDPMHRAETEQTLYDSMPGWLAEFEQEDVIDIEIDAGRRSHSVSLSRETWVKAASDLYQRVAEGLATSLADNASKHILLTHRVCSLPGFIKYLQNRLPDCHLTQLNEGSVAQGVDLYESQIRQSGETWQFVNRLEPLSSETVQESKLDKPLYMVYQGQARALSHEPLEIRCRPEQDGSGEDNHEVKIERHINSDSHAHNDNDGYCLVHLLNNAVMLERHGVLKTFVNQVQIFNDTRLHIGDSIHVGECGAALQLIQLLD